MQYNKVPVPMSTPAARPAHGQRADYFDMFNIFSSCSFKPIQKILSVTSGAFPVYRYAVIPDLISWN